MAPLPLTLVGGRLRGRPRGGHLRALGDDAIENLVRDLQVNRAVAEAGQECGAHVEGVHQLTPPAGLSSVVKLLTRDCGGCDCSGCE